MKRILDIVAHNVLNEHKSSTAAYRLSSVAEALARTALLSGYAKVCNVMNYHRSSIGRIIVDIGLELLTRDVIWGGRGDICPPP